MVMVHPRSLALASCISVPHPPVLLGLVSFLIHLLTYVTIRFLFAPGQMKEASNTGTKTLFSQMQGDLVWRNVCK